MYKYCLYFFILVTTVIPDSLSSMNNNRLTKILIVNPDMLEAHRAIAEFFISSFDRNDFNFVEGFFSESSEIDMESISKIRAEFDTIYPAKDFRLTTQTLAYRTGGSKLIFQCVYSRVNAAKRTFFFQITIKLNKANPLLIDDVKVEKQIKFPKKLKRFFRKIEKGTIREKKKDEVFTALQTPLAPPFYTCYYERHMLNEEKFWFITNSEDDCSYLNNLTSSQINQIQNPVAWYLNATYEYDLYPFLAELKKLEKLILFHKTPVLIPEVVGRFQQLKILQIYYYLDEPIEIPAFIGKLKSLEELRIICPTCETLPASLRKLNTLKSFRFYTKKRLSAETKKLVRDLKSIAARNKE